MDVYMQQAYTASIESYRPAKSLLDRLRSALTARGFPALIRAYHEKHRAVNHVMEENEHMRPRPAHAGLYIYVRTNIV
jgi:hypothetical protein